jgi:hypothetical protein
MTFFERIYGIFVAAVILNFIVFVGLTMHLGGDAVNGKRESGRYYLWGYNVHTGTKGYTEVSSTGYRYSKWHVYSIFITWPIMFIGGLVAQRRKRSRRNGK